MHEDGSHRGSDPDTPAGSEPESTPGSPGRRSGWLGGLGVLAAVAAVHFFREPASYLLPPLSYEDGRDFFAFFYNHREPGAILRFYAGYVSLIPNLLGYLVLALPTLWVPRALAAVPGVLVTLACALPYLTLRPLLPGRVWRLGTCLTLALLPVANRLFLSSLAYSIWPLLLLLVWGSLARPPTTVGAAGLRLLPMAALICSHPLSVALAPVYGLRAWLSGRVGGGGEPEQQLGGEARAGRISALYHGLLVAVAVLYQLFWVERGGVDPPAVWESVGRTLAFTAERVVFATVFGDAAALALRRAEAVLWIYAAAVLVLAVVVAIAVRHRRCLDRARVGVLLILAYLVLAFTGLYVLGRSPGLEILQAGAAFRYFWVQRLLFATALAVLAGAVLDPQAPGRLSRPRMSTLPRTGLLWLLFVALAVLNFQNGDRYRSPRRQGHVMAAFVQGVVRQETTGDGEVDATLPRRGPWSVELRRPPLRD